MDSYTKAYIEARKKRTEGTGSSAKTTSKANSADMEYTKKYIASRENRKITVPTGYQLSEANRQTMNDRAFSVSNAVKSAQAKNRQASEPWISQNAVQQRQEAARERDRERLNQLRSQKSQLEAGLALDQAASLDSEISALERKLGQTLPQRIGNTISGAAKQYLGGSLSFFPTLYGAGHNYRNNINETLLETEQHRLDRALRDYEIMTEENKKSPGTWSESDLRSTQNIINDARMRVAAYEAVSGAQEGAVKSSHELGAVWTQAGSEDLAKAKEDLDGIGSFAIDTMAAGLQMAGDIGLGAATGGGALLPMFVRSSGGAGQEASLSGATAAQQGIYGLASGALSVATEKISNVAGPFKKMFGEGVLDNAISKAVNRLGNTAAGNLAASAISEGSEEFIESLVQPVLQRAIYDPDASFDLEEALYEAAIGGALGLVGGGFEFAGNAAVQTIENAAQEQANRAADAENQRIDSAYAAMLANGMFSQEARQAMNQAGRTMPSDNGRSVQRTTAAPTSVQAQEASMPAVFSQEESIPAMEAHNRSSLARAAEAFGQQGKQTVQSFYDGQTSPAEYYGAFASYYQAGVNGTDINKVKSSYKSALNEPQRQAAYLAGQMDAAASLASEKSSVQYATVYGEESGFVPNEYSKGIDRKTTELYQAIGQATGIKITIAPATGAGGANGWYQNGTVYIAQDAENTGFVVAKHEITHRLQEIAPEQYRQYRDYAVSVLSQGSGSLVEQYRARYAQSGVNLTAEQAMDEIAADFTEALFTDQEKFSQMVQDNRSVARKVLDSVRDFIRKVKKALGLNRADQAARETFGVDLATLEEAERLWSQALETGRENIQTAQYLATEEGQRVELSDRYTRYSLREKDPPKKTGVAYKVFYAKNGQLYPPMVANPGGAGTPVGVWLDADIGQAAPPSKTGRAQVQAGGKGTNAAKGSLAFRPGWHLGDIPLAKQFARKNPETGVKDLFPADFVWAECEYAMDVDYQEEAMSYGYTENGKFRHSYAGLPKLPADGYYRYRTNPNPDTVPWVITGAMKVNRILTDAETDAICREAGVEPMQRQGGPMDAERLSQLGLKAGDVELDNIRFSMKSSVDEMQENYDSISRRVQELSRKKSQLEKNPEHEKFLEAVYSAKGDALDTAMEQYKKWSDENGLSDIANELAELKKQSQEAYRSLERAKSNALNEARKEYRAKFDDEFSKKYASKAARKFGTTSRFDLAGYLTVNGSLLNFSDGQGYRVQDHREIAQVLDFLPDYHEYSDGMIEFMNMGNIRLQSYGIDIAKAPNAKQRSMLKRFFQSLDGEVTVDFSLENGNSAGSIEYQEGTRAEKILRDIDSYFQTGVVPEQSEVAQFHTRYSIKQDSNGNKLTKEQQEFFKDSKVVDENGNLLVMYHGTPNAGFTEFRSGSYFTPHREWADVYQSPSASSLRPGKESTNPDTYTVYLNITKPFDTRNAEERRIFYDEYYRQWGTGTDLMESGLPDWLDGMDLQEFIEENGYDYDGLILDEGGVGGYGEEVISRGLSYVVFSPDQVKNTKNLSPTTDPDIRRSTKGSSILQENADLQEENALLRERVEYWKGQTKRTQRVTTDKKAVTRAARELIRSYDADLETADIAGDLQGLYDYIASGRDGNDELTYTEARRRADAIARKLVENASVLDDDTYQEYRDLRAYLRNTPLSISEDDSHDIADYGDFRRRNFGRLNLRKGPTNIDQVYQEMSEMWPEYFDEHRHSVPSDQLIHIAEVLDEIYRVTESNPFASYFDAAVADVSNEIMERFFDLPQTKATFADRQARKLDDAKARGRQQVERVRQQRDARLAELRQQNRERVQRAIQRERTTRARQLERLKTRYAARDAAGRERRNARELRARISRHVADLSRRLLRPSDKQHIPEQLRTAVAAMLDAINMESVYTVDPTTGKRRKGGNGDPTKRTEAFRALREAYANITKKDADYTLVIDPDLMDNLAELESMRDTPLAEMGTGQLSTVWATVKAVEASIRTANRMLGESQFRTIAQVAEGIRSDNIMRQDRGNYRGILGRVDKLVNLDMLTPQGYFHRMGPTGDALFHMLRSAQDRHIEIMRSAQEATQDIIGKANVSQMERETHTFDLNGQSVTMSTAQIMTLYELMKRKQAQEHIFVGGIRPDAVQTGRGLRESRRADAVHVSVEDLVEITGVLTEDQIKIADALQKYMGGQLAELGNEASMEVYGYRKFTEPDYFPIQVDRNQISQDISKEANAQTIAGRGFTKSTTPRANNAVMVGSIFDIYASHVNDMATYAAWLPTMENVRRIRDFTYWDSEGNRTGTFKSVIERIFGRNGNAYLNKLVDDLNQGVRSTGTGNFMDGIVSNYKAAAVAANLRVIAQQPTAILRALNILDPKYLLAGTVKRGDWQKVMKYAPIARWKDWGYFDINTGRQMKNVLLGSDSRLEKLRQIGMAGAGKADSFAWARLWNAVEAETKDRRPGLKPGTDAFYRAVGERFSEIVDQTQVVDGILQRSQIMRSTDALTKISTSFMGEPTKSYNMFVNAVYDLHHATGKEARNRAGKALARTSTALVVSFTINAIMQSLVDGLRDDDKETDYWEKVLQAFTGFTGEEETFLDYWNSFWSGNLEASYNPLAYMPYFKDFVSIAQGFDVTRMDMEAVEKVWTSITNMRKALTGEGKYSIAGASANMLAEVARLLGLPVANLKRDIRAVVTTAAIETDNYLLQYEMDKMLLNMGYQGNRNGFMDILYASSVNDPEAYELIYEDMVESGITEEQIRTAMERRMKDAQGVASVDELAQRYLTPSQERTYARLHSQVTSSPVWRAATSEQQKAVDQALYDLTAGTDTGVKMQEKINTGADYGISEVDYLLYLTALEIADAENEDPEKRNGSIDQSEAQIAIDMLTGLLDEGRAYLWQSTNKGWSEKNNPYR